MKKKKNLVQKFGNGYCIICIVRNETVLQYSLLVLDCIAGCRTKLYCNRQVCIASEVAWLGWFLGCNTKILYCGAGQAGRRPGAHYRPRDGQGRAATRRWAL